MPESFLRVVVDRVVLQQVILNLIMNAMEAMRAVGNRAAVLAHSNTGAAFG
jgi:C4-dicarboxylate-specific signal transduction histidine kinase